MIWDGGRAAGITDRVVFWARSPTGTCGPAFAGAGVFVSVSEHEGFGVPILEAMAARVPVVAYGSAAMPETIGGAGILFRTKDPAVVAAAVQASAAIRGCGSGWSSARPPGSRRSPFDVARALRRLVERASGTARPSRSRSRVPSRRATAWP